MGKNLPSNAGDKGSIPELGRSPGGGNGNPVQYSCLENPTDRGAWWATAHGVTESQTQLSTSMMYDFIIKTVMSLLYFVSIACFKGENKGKDRLRYKTI